MHRYRLVPVLLHALSLLILSPSLKAQEDESYAILDLEGRGISTLEAASLTDRLRSELVRTGRITVVERGFMQQILTEQDFQLAGCTSDECAVAVGQLLGVTKMLAGSIGRVGSTFSIDARIIDVETGKIVATVMRNYRGEIDGLLDQMGSLAQELISQEKPEDVTQQPIQPTPQPELETLDKMVSKWEMANKGIKLSLNLANVRGEDTEDFDLKTKSGFAVGGYATFDFGLPVLIRSEVMFTQKGFTMEYSETEEGMTIDSKSTIGLHYLDINALAVYPVNDQICIFAGPSFAPFLSGKIKTEVDISVEGEIDPITQAFIDMLMEVLIGEEDLESDDMNGMDIAFIIGAGYNLGIVNVEARYSLGLKNAYDADDDMKNNVIQIIVGYGF